MVSGWICTSSSSRRLLAHCPSDVGSMLQEAEARNTAGHAVKELAEPQCRQKLSQCPTMPQAPERVILVIPKSIQCFFCQSCYLRFTSGLWPSVIDTPSARSRLGCFSWQPRHTGDDHASMTRPTFNPHLSTFAPLPDHPR